MDWIGIISLVLNLLFGGGLFMSLVTLKSERKKAESEAKGVEISNTEKLLETNNKYIVEPLKKEIYALRKDFRKLQQAVEKAIDCPYSDNCPVRNELQNGNECNQQRADNE
jgi:flagellar basal body-associated protein FliL